MNNNSSTTEQAGIPKPENNELLERAKKHTILAWKIKTSTLVLSACGAYLGYGTYKSFSDKFTGSDEILNNNIAGFVMGAISLAAISVAFGMNNEANVHVNVASQLTAQSEIDAVRAQSASSNSIPQI